MTDRFEGRAEGVSAPAARGFAITPSDSSDLAAETRAIYVGGSGNVSLVLASGDALTFAGLVAGTLLPVRAARVKATGTSATMMLGLY